jgi:hypothetical protein
MQELPNVRSPPEPKTRGHNHLASRLGYLESAPEFRVLRQPQQRTVRIQAKRSLPMEERYISALSQFFVLRH